MLAFDSSARRRKEARMRAIDFSDYVDAAPRGQALMARIALNAAGLAERYPVDVSELRGLSLDNRACVNGFLEWMELNPDCRFGLIDLPRLERYADPKFDEREPIGFMSGHWLP